MNEDEPLWVYRLPVAGTVACIRGFEVVTSSVNPIRPTVRVLTTDEPVEIDVMMATLPGERGAAAVEARRARLQEWLARGPVDEPVTGLD